MNIHVRVISAKALAQLRAVEAQSRRTAVSGMGAMNNQARIGIPMFAKYGSQVQWAGRQLTYNFTLPIMLAMGAATKFALENEKAMVRVTKVYGDGSKKINRFAKTEIPALADAFEALSSRFGVHQSEVIGIAGDWAAAGASGLALAKVTKLTLETMVLGELEAADATKQLIAIQAQYGQSTAQLTKTIDVLNMVENQTGTTMKDLMQGMSRAAGVARGAGIDVEHLAAMMAALVPATGSAASAGNGLKTMISRLFAPTEDAADIMQRMGMEVDSLAWQSLNGTERVEKMAEAFQGLSDGQRATVSSYIASRYQINRFSVLMDAVVNQNSYYNKTLKATNDRQAIFTQRMKELNTVLMSNPQRMKQAWVILQNALSDVIIPLLPFIVYLTSELARMASAFANLDGGLQKLILGVLVFIAALGPTLRIIGAFGTLLGYLHVTLQLVALAFAGLAKIMLGPVIGAAILLGKLTIGLSLRVGGALVAMASWVAVNLLKVYAIAATRFTAFAAVLAAQGTYALMARGIIFVGTIIMAVMSTTTSLALGRWIGMLASMRIAQYVWLVTSMGLFRTWLFKVATIFTLLPAMIGPIMSTLWAMMIVPGYLAGTIIAMWGSIMAAMRTMWLVLHKQLILIHLAFAGGVLKGFALIGAGFRALATGMVLIWPRVLAILAGLVPLMMSIFSGMASMLAGLGTLVATALTSPIGIAVLAALGIAYYFRDQLVAIWNNITNGASDVGAGIQSAFVPVGNFFTDLSNHIVDAFWALPESVTGAMLAVLRVIRDVAVQIYEWMSYINPFARHSPSLVESVKAGMDAIETQYKRAAGVGSAFAAANKHLQAFKKLSNSMGGGEFADDRQDVKKSMPQALPLFNALVNDLGNLQPLMDRQEAAVARQQAVVDRWQKKLDAANAALDRQQNKLDILKGKLTAVQDRYDMHAAAMQNFADAPITGMGKMNEKIFENEIAQKRLMLQMKKWEQANGSIEDMSSRLGALYGDIELLRGEATSLRMAGAGSDVLGPIEAQIAAMEAQAVAATKAINDAPINDMQKQLEELQKQGEILQLQYDVKYDPMVHQIEQLANAQKELSFDEITAGIKTEKAAMEALQPTLDSLTAAVARQQAVVDQYAAARDRVQKSYDRENAQLQTLNDKYQKTADLVREIESALNGMGSAASSAAAKANKTASKVGAKGPELSNALTSFEAGAGANFPDVGGKQAISRLTGKNETEAIRDFADKELRKMNKIFGGFDMFEPIKKWWTKTWAWIKENVGPVVTAVRDGIKNGIKGIGDSAGWASFVEKAQDAWEKISYGFRVAWNFIKKIIKLFAPDFKRMFNEIVKAARRIWNEIGPELVKLGEVLWPVVKVIGGALIAALKLAASIIGHTLGPVLNFLIDRLKGTIMIIRGFFQIIVGIFTADGAMLKEGVLAIFRGLWTVTVGLFKGVVSVLWGIVKGLVGGIIGFFKWLYDEMVGHSIIPDLITAIVWWFKSLIKIVGWLWNNVIKPLFQVWKTIMTKFIIPFLKTWFSLIVGAWKVLFKVAAWLWENVLKPVWKFVNWLWDSWVKPSLKGWWEGIKLAWAILTKVAGWVWENVLKPIFNRIRDLWTNEVKPELVKWKERIQGAWENLKAIATWVKENVMDPVFNAFKEGWGKIKEWFQDNAGIILTPIQSVVNGIIKAINWIIRGLNKLDALPGIAISISEITPPFAKGGTLPGRRVGNGFVTQGARAIVGEGKANYPEYVIPTDPTYRRRAQALLADAAGRVNMATVPMHAEGGVMGGKTSGSVTYNDSAIDSLVDFGKDVGGALKGLGKNAIGTVMKPYLAGAKLATKLIAWDTGQDAARGAIGVVEKWLDGVKESWSDQYSAATAGGGNVTVMDPSNPGSHVLWKGGEFTKRFVAHMQKAEQIANTAVNVIQGGFRPATSYSGTSHQGDAVDFQANAALIKAFRRVGIAAGDRTGLGLWGPHAHAVPGPGAGSAGGSAVWQWQDYVARGGMSQAINSPWGLKTGGIIKARAGGTMFRGGEGGQDEAVIPLPRDWRNDAFGGGNGGDTVININGNLEFPNIKSGDDAEQFVKNLQLLAKD